MRESWMKHVLTIRYAIFVIALGVVIGLFIFKCMPKKREKVLVIDYKNLAFWPPDMVPHPTPPEPEPQDNDPNNPRNWA